MRKFSNITKIIILALIFILLFGVNSFAATMGPRRVFYYRLRGDLDGNGQIDPGDTRIISKYSVNSEKPSFEQQIIADIDKDGRVTSEDTRLASRASVGLSYVTPEYAIFYYVYGDLNHDGRFTSEDCRQLQRYFAGLRSLTPMEKCAVDVNGDGEITMEDLRLFNKRNVSLITAFPIEGDIDGNGKIEYNDAYEVLCESVGYRNLSEAQKRLADVNRDGIIDTTDARIIYRRSCGLE